MVREIVGLSLVRGRPDVLCCVLLALAVSLASPVRAQAPRSRPLALLTLEELLEVEVTTASRKEERLSRVAAAIFVITAEDIRRSGLTSIPEILRMAPGLDVARIDATKWAVSARGFNSRFANKMLVLVDGRSVYSPLFSGTTWETLDVALEDVERIEVIRGPGGTVWGANAVNGVINIVTKTARQTQGGRVSIGTGNEDRVRASLRYGGALGADGAYRVNAQVLSRSQWPVEEPGSTTAEPADWRSVRAGFRADLIPSARDTVNLHGDFHDGSFGQIVDVYQPARIAMAATVDRADVRGGHVLGRWTRAFAGGGSMDLQAAYDYGNRQEASFGEIRHTASVEVKRRRPVGRRQDLVWGVDLHVTADRLRNTDTTMFDPVQGSDYAVSAFIHDDIIVAPDRLALTLGTKVERGRFVGVQLEPGVQLLWTPGPLQSIWAGVSRAVRTPARSDRDVTARLSTGVLPGGIPFVAQAMGTDGLGSEALLAWEAGWRVRPAAWWSIDAAAFLNDYDGLIRTQPGAPEPGPGAPTHLVVPALLRNGAGYRTGGLEVVTTISPTPAWRVVGSYTWLEADRGPVRDQVPEVVGANPEHQGSVRAAWNPGRDVELDVALFAVGRLLAVDVPGYLRADVRLGWRPRGRFELSLGGQNLFDPSHVEFASTYNEHAAVIGRSFYGTATWRF